MTMPANMPQGVEALTQVFANALAPYFNKLEAGLATVCAAVNGGAAGASAMSTQVEKHDCGGACGKANCDGKSCSTAIVLDVQTGNGRIPMWNLPGAAPECYAGCEPVNKCLVPLLAESRSRFDDVSWAQLWVSDPTLIHFDKVVSAAVGTYLAALPLTSNTKIILAQEDAQQLPYLPDFFKVDWKFSDHEAADKVIVRIFAGPRGLTGLTTSSGLVKLGNDLKLADFECKDDCYFFEYPKFMGCRSTGIPDTRSVYIELEAQALGGGGNQLDSINFTLFKRGSKKAATMCSRYNLEW